MAAAFLLSSQTPQITDGTNIISGDDDRLSSLPDAQLITILSLLDDPREVVQTCVLSKRWHNLWTFVPCLNLDFFAFCKKANSSELERFENFVGSLLRLRDDASNLHSFRLRYKMLPCSMSWIRYALSHNLKNLQLELCGLGSEDCLDLTDCLSTCDSLEEFYLEFQYCYEKPQIIISDKVYLPKLIKVVFRGANMRGDSMKKFLSGCPALKTVQLLYCVMNMKCISFENVKKLKLMECKFINKLPSFSIFGPRLEHLDYTRCDERGVEFKNMSNVKKAFMATFFLDKGNLSSFSCVEVLIINSMTMLKETLQAELPNCPKFRNLKKLSLAMECFHCAFGVLCSFLKHCPNLEHLTLCQSDMHCKGVRVEKVEKFGCNRLKIVQVIGGYDSYGFDLHKLMPLLTESTSELGQIQILHRKLEKSS